VNSFLFPRLKEPYEATSDLTSTTMQPFYKRVMSNDTLTTWRAITSRLQLYVALTWSVVSYVAIQRGSEWEIGQPMKSGLVPTTNIVLKFLTDMKFSTTHQPPNIGSLTSKIQSHTCFAPCHWIQVCLASQRTTYQQHQPTNNGFVPTTNIAHSKCLTNCI